MTINKEKQIEDAHAAFRTALKQAEDAYLAIIDERDTVVAKARMAYNISVKRAVDAYDAAVKLAEETVSR